MNTWKPKPDPLPRKDGLCRREGCGKPVPPVARAAGDPWCSSACCREFHEVDITMPWQGKPVASTT